MPIFEEGKRRQILEIHVKNKTSTFFHLLLTSNRSVTIIELPSGYFDEGDNYGRFAQGL